MAEQLSAVCAASGSPGQSYTTLLLKTRSTPNDAYALLPDATFLPVLTHTFLSDAARSLRTLLSSPSSSPNAIIARYGGLIITSQRAVEALGRVLSSLSQVGEDEDLVGVHGDKAVEDEQVSREARATMRSWRGVVYVVGPATGKAVRELLAAWMPQVAIVGEDAGNGAALAQVMLREYQRVGETTCGDTGTRDNSNRAERLNGVQGQRQPLLFLVGEQRRDIIPKTLQSEQLLLKDRITVDEMVVYETEERREFGGEFGLELERTEGCGVRWVVVFSPTGCEAMLRVLGWLGGDKRYDKARRARDEQKRIYVASIGPTTRDFLKDTFGFDVDVCAEKPSASGVRNGIEEFTNQLEHSTKQASALR